MANQGLALMLILLAASGFQTPKEQLPMQDCDNCLYMAIHNPAEDGPGHCYMFETAPEGDRCGQFRKVD